MHNEEVVQEQPDQASVTERYVENAVHFMRENKDQPFFLYFAHMYVHRPCYAPERFVMKSQNGRYGACVECVDWSTGALMQELDKLGLTDNTIVMFTSDNGAEGRQERSCRPLRGHKGTTWEGGQRLPFIVRWPAKIPAGTECSEMITSMDLLPTLASITGGQVPTDRKIDGKDVTPLFLGEEDAKTPHEAFFYYLVDKLEAVRSGKWKLHLERRELYDLEADISESNNVIDDHPDVVERLETLAQACREDIGDSLKEMEGANCRPSGKAENPETITKTDLNHPYVIAMYDLDGGYSSLEESDDLGELITIMEERRKKQQK
jgi:arylsulfatase A-like enzyme